VERKLRDLVAERPEPEAFLIQVHPRVSGQLVSGPGRPILELEKELGRHFHFEGSEGLPIDHFAVLMEGNRDEVAQRALPFREGEEVLVRIEEPHMYNEDDGVAKVDGYMIAVSGGVRHLGEQKLVRIEQVGRSAAAATIVGAAGGESDSGGEEEAPDEDDPETPKRRRRGRRGGRGRGGRGRGGRGEEAVAEAADAAD
jgi:ribonuclease G